METCAFCGMPMADEQPPGIPGVKKKHTILWMIVIAAVIVIISVTIGIIMVNRKLTNDKYEQKVNKGDRYLAELDYDSAILAYNEALELNEKDEDVYMKLAEAYQGRGDLTSADDILTRGYQMTGSRRIKNMLNNLLAYASIFGAGDTTAKTTVMETLGASGLELNTAWLDKIMDMGYTDYTGEYGQGISKFENGSEVLSVTYTGFKLWYVNSGSGGIIDTSTSRPDGNIRPSYITIDDYATIFGSSVTGGTYDEVCALFGEGPDIKKDNSRNYLMFHYAGSTLYFGCTEDGALDMDNVWIKVVVPGAGVNKDENANKGIVTGQIIDASTGKGLCDVRLSFRSGRDNKTGGVAAEIYTDNWGNYTAELEAGEYTMGAELEGYQTEFLEVTVKKGETVYDQNLTMSSLLGSGEVRIVLEWGSTPMDLDAHLTGTIGSESFHVYFVNPEYKDLVTLDVDDTDGYGPETITISDISSGTFEYSVYNYSFEDTLEVSGATVKVYMAGENEPRIYTVPPMDCGEMRNWKVFRIENGQIVDENYMEE